MIEANDILAYASICISTLIGTLYALQIGRITKLETKTESLQKTSDINSKDSASLEKVIEKLSEFQLSNKDLHGSFKELDTHVRHSVADLRTTVNGFGARLVAIEDDVKEKLNIDYELKARLDVIEKLVLEKK